MSSAVKAAAISGSFCSCELISVYSHANLSIDIQQSCALVIGTHTMVLCRYPLLFWLQGLQANIGIMMVLRGWRNAISAEGWLVRSCNLYSAHS
jgi:hypothetical protein